MANNSDMQKKVREEIENKIGDRMATHEDRNNCDYVVAFINEALRYRPTTPIGTYHRAMCDGMIGTLYHMN
jgi:cytochrome P450